MDSSVRFRQNSCLQASEVLQISLCSFDCHSVVVGLVDPKFLLAKSPLSTVVINATH